MHINALHVPTKFGETAHFTVLVGPSCPRQYCRVGSSPPFGPSSELCESRGVTELRMYWSHYELAAASFREVSLNNGAGQMV